MKRKGLRSLFTLFSAVLAVAVFFTACGNGSTSDSASNEALSIIYTSNIRIGSDTYTTLKLAPNGTYSMQGLNCSDYGIYGLDRGIADGKYIFESHGTYRGHTFIGTVAGDTIKFEKKSMTVTGAGTTARISGSSYEYVLYSNSVETITMAQDGSGVMSRSGTYDDCSIRWTLNDVDARTITIKHMSGSLHTDVVFSGTYTADGSSMTLVGTKTSDPTYSSTYTFNRK